MKIFEANIPYQVFDFLEKELRKESFFVSANLKLLDFFGISQFFTNEDEFLLLKETIRSTSGMVEEPDRAEYGDFQTNLTLARAITAFLKSNNVNPKLIVEPTCGKGNFIVASLLAFPDAEKIIGVEIYKPYIWETKFNIIQHYLDNPPNKKPLIEINHFNVFDFDFRRIAIEHHNYETLVIGNPPWVTNAKLSSLESGNLPVKSNFKKHSGLDAMTGKGNFDIGEFITLMMFDAFQNSSGHFAFLVKNSVIKNVLFYQKDRAYAIGWLQKLIIDSKKEFNVSVDAALLFSKLNTKPEFTCTESDFYGNFKTNNQFGWVNGKFVSNMGSYKHSSDIDGVCPFEWRQGIKHDLSSIMELEKVNDRFVNGHGQEILLEEDLVYGFLKSSDLKEAVISTTRKHTIVTQKKVGQDTSFIQKEFPNTYKYLFNNKALFDARKSSIYKHKPDFSIFGIGDYSFAPYKVAISGLYKTFTFSLILPQENKPIMLDDTCYLLGFDNLEFAAYTLVLLNSDKTKALLQSITFSDAKRTFTKDILMRINLYQLALQMPISKMQQELLVLDTNFNLGVRITNWNGYLCALKPVEKTMQLDIFG